MIGTANSWLMRTAATFAHLERALKAVPVPPAQLYPATQSPYAYPLTFPGWDVLERQGQNQNDRDLKAAKTASTSPWVFANVQAIANEFSTAELVVKERTGTKLEDVENHPLELLWESPNEHMGRSFLTAFWAWSYVLASKAYLYWVPDTSGTELMEVWPVPPFMLRPVPDARDFISGYAFKSRSDAAPILIPPHLITYSHSVNLFDARDGLSFLAAAMTEIKADLAASEWNLNFFDENNGLPDGLVGLSPDALDQDVERVRMELRDFFGGTKRGIAVARSNDLKYTQFGRSQKDMEFSQGREFASKIIGRTLGFPDGYWSDLANRANAEQARKTMISGAVWPLLTRLAEDMNAKRRGVVHRWYGDQYRVEFKDIRPEDRQLFLQEQAARKDYWIINELREADGKDPLDDVRGLMLIAEINKGTPIPGTEAAQELDDLQAEKDEAAAQKQAEMIEAGLAPDPTEQADAGVLPEETDGLPVKAQSAEERAMFAKLSGGKGPGKGYSKEKSKLWKANKDGTRNDPEGLFGSAYEARQAHLQSRAAARGGSSGSSSEPSQAAREHFFEKQTPTTHEAAGPKIVKQHAAATATSSGSAGVDKPERYAELEAQTQRVKMPQAGWNAPMSDKQAGYLGSLADKARAKTTEGSPQRALADEISAAVKSGKLSKWEASQFIDAMQRPKPMTTLLQQAQSGVRGGGEHDSWRAVLALPKFRVELINHTLSSEAQAEGLPF